MELRKLNVDDIRVEVFAEDEDLPIRGSFSCGDSEKDEETAREIETRLNRGDIWAWCSVRVKVSYKTYSAKSYLGACSYKNANDFIENSGYYESLVDEALDELNAEIVEHFRNLAPLIVRW